MEYRLTLISQPTIKHRNHTISSDANCKNKLVCKFTWRTIFISFDLKANNFAVFLPSIYFPQVNNNVAEQTAQKFTKLVAEFNTFESDKLSHSVRFLKCIINHPRQCTSSEQSTIILLDSITVDMPAAKCWNLGLGTHKQWGSFRRNSDMNFGFANRVELCERCL